MKNLFTALLLSAAALSAQASGVELVVEKVDNGGLVPGETYRVYAILESPQHSLHAVFGEGGDELSIQSTTNFFQSPYGGYLSSDVNPGVINVDPASAFDTWVTIGAENSQNNNLWTIGVDYEAFADGGNLSATDGAWFLVPTDVRTLPDASNMILLMQLTTDGTAYGNLNFQGWDQEGMTWQARNVPFTSENAHIFGCMQENAPNYNAEATFDDGSCEAATGDGDHGGDTSAFEGTTEMEVSKGDSFTVFPNPIWEGQFNLQFNRALKLSDENLVVEIYDGAGKRVYAEEVTSQAIIGGNRVIIDQELAAGTYTVNARTSTFSSSAQIVVTR